MSLKAARQAANRRMTDTCVISRPPKGHQELDPVTLQMAGPIEIHSGPCMFGDRLTGNQVDRGHGDFREENSMLRLPIMVETEIRVDDVVTISHTNTGNTSTWSITATPTKSVEVSRRFKLHRIIQEVQHS